MKYGSNCNNYTCKPESGLGFETVKQMKEGGYKVFITARVLGKISELPEKTEVPHRHIYITNDHSMSRLAKNLEMEFGGIYVLINNAGSFFDQGGKPIN